jgi:hypothetical protein
MDSAMGGPLQDFFRMECQMRRVLGKRGFSQDI